MKKFLLTLGILSLIGSYLLHSKFKYNFTVIIYHLLIIACIIAFVFAGNVLLSRIRYARLRSIVLNTFNFLVLVFFITFYVTILGSNVFWGKAISSKLFLSYLLTFDDFISILPVEKWIIYGAVIVFLLLVTVLYLLVRPRPAMLSKSYTALFAKERRRSVIITLIALIGLFILFFRPLLSFKRNMHFSGEPVLEFVYGPMWNSGTTEFVYDKKRIQNGLKDKPCIDAVTRETDKNKKRVVVVILLDALRSDFLPIYGYNRDTTPFIDSLSNTGQLIHVQNMFSTSTTTLLGVGGLFSSKDWETFSYTGLNIMKFLKRKGFSTYAFLTGQHRSWYGLTDIYKSDCDFFYESTTVPTHQNFDDLTTLQEFRETKIEDRSFVYIHLLSTHAIGKKNDQFRKYLPDKIGIGTDQKAAFVNNYDNGIIQADYVIGEVFRKLKRDGQLENSSIYIVADHGELFGEDGRWSHSGSIQQNILSIPLLIYDQDLSWYKNREAATIKDVAPTIVDRLGYDLPVCWEGTSLHQPVHDFSIHVSSGSKCEFPEGILSRKDTSYQLQIMNEEGALKKTLTRGVSKDWSIIASY
jgi:glucan phosphoethanolaminetransferase (alkaline phosphatase superfamily)